MSIFTNNNANIYYEESGSGEPIIVIHGLSENSTYWTKAGVAAELAKQYRIILMDMRGHGRTVVEGEPTGFNVETVMNDIDALADFLKIKRFHLLTHSTGGMAAVRYAINRGQRLLSMIITNSSSSTDLFAGDDDARQKMREKLALSFEKHTWDETISFTKKNPWPFFLGIDKQPDKDKIWTMVEEMFKLSDPKVIASFIRSFYTDSDPQIQGLRKIICPTFIIVSEHDVLMLEPSRLMAKEIHDAKFVELKGIGHMTAFESPKQLVAEILDFLRTIS